MNFIFMLIKIHHTYRDVVAICDTEILGKTYEEGIKILDVRKSFYEGDEKTEQETIEIMRDLQKEDATFNIVGEKAVSAALRAGIIKKEGIGKVQGVPFALVLL